MNLSENLRQAAVNMREEAAEHEQFMKELRKQALNWHSAEEVERLINEMWECAANDDISGASAVFFYLGTGVKEDQENG